MKTQRELDELAVRAELRLARFHKRFMEQYMKERLEERFNGEEENQAGRYPEGIPAPGTPAG